MSGYLWLLFIWLEFGDELGSNQQSSPIFDRLNDLYGLVGDLGLIVEISVAAYILGSITADVLWFPIRRNRGDDLLRIGLDGAEEPTLKYVAAHAERTWAEAELRYCSVPPLLAIAWTLRPHLPVVSLVLVASSIVLIAHAVILYSRHYKQSVTLWRIADERRAARLESARWGTNAVLVVRFLLLSPDPEEVREALEITNIGHSEAKMIYVRAPDTLDVPAFVDSRSLPIRNLDQRESAEIPLTLSDSDPAHCEVVLEWVDRAGHQAKLITVHLA